MINHVPHLEKEGGGSVDQHAQHAGAHEHVARLHAGEGDGGHGGGGAAPLHGVALQLWVQFGVG